MYNKKVLIDNNYQYHLNQFTEKVDTNHEFIKII